jgi:hypothetical protein
MLVTVKTEARHDHRLPRAMWPAPTFKVIDWTNSSDRKWLKNHTHWAMMNQTCITLVPALIVN